jgi:ketosteroid isomerase-like protein
MLTLDDRRDIEQLYVTYNQAVDGNDIDSWMSVYDRNATFRGRVQLQGHTQLREFAIGELKRMHNRGFDRMQHWTSVPQIHGDANEATSTCYLLLIQRPMNGRENCHIRVASYLDRLRKVDGRWLFVDRQLFWWPDAEQRFRRLRLLPHLIVRGARRVARIFLRPIGRRE